MPVETPHTNALDQANIPPTLNQLVPETGSEKGKFEHFHGKSTWPLNAPGCPRIDHPKMTSNLPQGKQNPPQRLSRPLAQEGYFSIPIVVIVNQF
jgi:hypothetical protein